MSALLDLLPLGSVVSFVLDHWAWLAPLAGGLGASIPFGGPILAFVGANWRWLLPALAIAGLGVDDVRLRLKVDGLELQAATEAEARARAIDTANRKAEQLESDLVIAEASAMAVTTRTKAVYVERIHNDTTPDTACAGDPRMRLGTHGVHDILDTVVAPQAGGAPAAVPGPAGGRAGPRP